MEEKKSEFMRRAIALSEQSVRTGGGPFGAVIVRDNDIIAEASFNTVKLSISLGLRVLITLFEV